MTTARTNLPERQDGVARGYTATVSYTPGYAHCDKHGELTGNLCERCLESLAGFSPIFSPRALLVDSLLYAFGFLLYAIDWTLRKLVELRVMAILSVICRFSIKAIIFVGSTLFTAISCFFLMWFIQPDVSPHDRRRKELDDARKKADDEAWRARRDADWDRQRSEQDAWESQRDADYRRQRAEQDQWEAERDAAYHKARQEDADRRRKEREDEDARQDKLLAEAQALAAKLAQPSGDVDNDIRKLEEISKDVDRSAVPEARATDHFIEKAKEEAVKAIDKDIDKDFSEAINLLPKVFSDTNDGSADKSLLKVVDDINDKEDNRKKIRDKQK